MAKLTARGTRATGPLSPRQALIGNGVMRGLSNKEIAAELGIREQTVKNYLQMMFARLGVHNRAALAVWVASHGSTPLKGGRT